MGSERRTAGKTSTADVWTTGELLVEVMRLRPGMSLAETGVLTDNLREVEIPLPLLSQHLPLLCRRVTEGSCAALPEPLGQESISLVLESYSAATTPGR
jgi:hypothetical protein